MATLISQLIIRSDTASNWLDGGWLDKSELGFDTTYHVLKIGTADHQLWDDAKIINDLATLESLGITATADEINILDGVVISGTELNYLLGVRSNVQEQLDSKADGAHTHTYEKVKSIDPSGEHSHNINIPTQTFKEKEVGKYVLVFGSTNAEVSSAGSHTHEITTETQNTSSASQTQTQ